MVYEKIDLNIIMVNTVMVTVMGTVTATVTVTAMVTVRMKGCNIL